MSNKTDKTPAEEESPIISRIRDYMMGHGGYGGNDNREVDLAMNVEPSTGTAHGYSKGGIVTPYPEIEQELDEEGTKGSSDESNDPEYVDMPHFDEGTIVGDPYDFSKQDLSQTKSTSDPITVPPAVHAPINPATIPPPVQNMPAPPPTPPMAPSKSLPGLPPNVTPDDFQNYLKMQRAAVNKYNPDQGMALAQNVLQQRGGLGNRIARGGATFADAVMQGVAGAGNPGFLKAEEDRENQGADLALKAQETARKGTMEQLEANQKIDAQDPSSPISRVTQKAMGPQLVKAGLPASAIPYISASLADGIATKQVTLAEALARINEEATYHKGMLGIQQQSEETRKGELAKGGAEAYLKQGSPLNPFNPVTFAGRRQALQTLQNPATAGNPAYAPDEMQFAKMHNLAPAQAKAILDKRKGAQ